MHSKQQACKLLFHTISQAAKAVFATAIVLKLTLVLAQPVQAQTFTVIYNFSDGMVGGSPEAGLIMDTAGNLYGTTHMGGPGGNGAVFKLTSSGATWTPTLLYSFTGGNDGSFPASRLTFGTDGSLFGTTRFGGGGTCYDGDSCGTLFNVRPPANACHTQSCSWLEGLLHRFQGGDDGWWPASDVVLDRAGNVYGATHAGGAYGVGEIYTMSKSGGVWTKTTIYSFPWTDDSHGAGPTSLMLSTDGNLYGTTDAGGAYHAGTVFQLAPSVSGWTETVLHSFVPGQAGDGTSPEGGLITDPAGNFYGTTFTGGRWSGGTVYELANVNGTWILTVLHNFAGLGWGPVGSLTRDTVGSLYGASFGNGAYGEGNIFELTPTGTGWTYRSLHDFTGGSDGAQPSGGLVLDSRGNLYGTDSVTGVSGPGVVFEITP